MIKSCNRVFRLFCSSFANNESERIQLNNAAQHVMLCQRRALTALILTTEQQPNENAQ